MDNLSDLTALRVFDGVVARVVHGDQASLAIVELAPGAEVPEHRHPHDQLGVLLRGSVTFQIGTDRRALRPGAVWRILGGIPHHAVAGPDGAVVVEAFAPRRADWDALPAVSTTPPLTWPP